MADALISPAVGGTMWAATAGLTAYSARKLKQEIDDGKVPLMGVLGAFVFSVQMINFTIPVTGSSGHLGGGMILAILLGPHAACLVMASILTVQALFFADGGLLALGCNIFNLGFFPCFVAYPLIYKPIAGAKPTEGRLFAGAVVSAVLALQMGAFGVILETLFSGLTALPFATFALLMQPIHLAIGIVEGVVTALVAVFVWKARPEIVEMAVPTQAVAARRLHGVLAGFLALAVATGGAFSWFASAYPDGLEWAITRTSGKEELEPPGGGVHSVLARLQQWTAFLPAYGFKTEEAHEAPKEGLAPVAAEPSPAESWPAVSAGTSVAGVVGSGITLAVAGLIGFGLKGRRLSQR
jgi:cobalt/nickel transport system permease protein